MKKIYYICIVTLLFMMALPINCYADMGDMGFFGGIIEGRKLPKTTETILKESKTGAKTSKTNASDEFVYKELVLIGGRPAEAQGSLSVKQSKQIADDETSGTYTVTYAVKPVGSKNAEGSADTPSVTRDIVFDVTWRREGLQVIKDYKIKSWNENISSGGASATLLPDVSHFSISIIEDHTPGIVYYKGDVYMSAVYSSGGGEGGNAGGDDQGEQVTVQTTGKIYGYSSAWSNAETHRLDTRVYTPTWQMEYQVRPSVSVNKELQYSENEPTVISFEGNYRELISNTSALTYTILVKPAYFYDEADSGSMNIDSYNNFEQLIAPDTSFLKGHFAEADINKLFAMEVLTGNPKFFQPAQAMTRGQYVQAIAKAIKLPIEKVEEKKTTKKSEPVKIIFPDVLPEREEYPYIIAAYRAQLAMGRDNGNFYIDANLQRQEAIVILVRALGLENLGLDPTPMTPFTDDKNISSWAKKEVYAAQVLGLISGDSDGKFRPTDVISKAEGAALVNRLISYMRTDLVTDYTDHIINYTN